MADVVAVGTCVSSKLGSIGKAMEQAMVDAIHRCYEAGVTDDESILKAKMEALEVVKAKFSVELS